LRETDYHPLTPTSYFVIFPNKEASTILVPKWHAIEGIVEDQEALKAAETMWELFLIAGEGDKNEQENPSK
jgi:hypothetical protein